MTAPTRRGYGKPGITVHRATTLASIDHDVCHGMPVTSLARTMIDLATVVSESSLEYAIHRAEARRMLTPADLHEILARLPRKKGTAPVRAIAGAPHHDLDARTRGPWERRFLAVCRAHEIPEPRVNEWIALDIAAGGLEVDFYWPLRALVVEVDEEASHRTLRARRNDPERDRALRAAGWRVVRIAQDEFSRTRPDRAEGPRRPRGRAASVELATAAVGNSTDPRHSRDCAPDRYPRPSPWRRRFSP